jgi:hypothetical protein
MSLTAGRGDRHGQPQPSSAWARTRPIRFPAAAASGYPFPPVSARSRIRATALRTRLRSGRQDKRPGHSVAGPRDLVAVLAWLGGGPGARPGGTQADQGSPPGRPRDRDRRYRAQHPLVADPAAAPPGPRRDGRKPDDTHSSGADLYANSVVPSAGHDWITRPFRALVRLSVLRSQVYDLGVAVYQWRVREPP